MAKQIYTDHRPVDGTGRFEPPRSTHQTGIAPSTNREGRHGRDGRRGRPAHLVPIRTEPVVCRSR